jgi:hypothetical protein
MRKTIKNEAVEQIIDNLNAIKEDSTANRKEIEAIVAKFLAKHQELLNDVPTEDEE